MKDMVLGAVIQLMFLLLFTEVMVIVLFIMEDTGEVIMAGVILTIVGITPTIDILIMDILLTVTVMDTAGMAILIIVEEEGSLMEVDLHITAIDIQEVDQILIIQAAEDLILKTELVPTLEVSLVDDPTIVVEIPQDDQVVPLIEEGIHRDQLALLEEALQVTQDQAVQDHQVPIEALEAALEGEDLVVEVEDPEAGAEDVVVVNQ